MVYDAVWKHAKEKETKKRMKARRQLLKALDLNDKMSFAMCFDDFIDDLNLFDLTSNAIFGNSLLDGPGVDPFTLEDIDNWRIENIVTGDTIKVPLKEWIENSKNCAYIGSLGKAYDRASDVNVSGEVGNLCFASGNIFDVIEKLETADTPTIGLIEYYKHPSDIIATTRCRNKGAMNIIHYLREYSTYRFVERQMAYTWYDVAVDKKCDGVPIMHHKKFEYRNTKSHPVSPIATSTVTFIPDIIITDSFDNMSRKNYSKVNLLIITMPSPKVLLKSGLLEKDTSGDDEILVKASKSFNEDSLPTAYVNMMNVKVMLELAPKFGVKNLIFDICQLNTKDLNSSEDALKMVAPAITNNIKEQYERIILARVPARFERNCAGLCADSRIL